MLRVVPEDPGHLRERTKRRVPGLSLPAEAVACRAMSIEMGKSRVK